MRRFNLLPESMQSQETFGKLLKSFLVFGGATCVFLASLHFVLSLRAQHLEKLIMRPSGMQETETTRQFREKITQIQAQVEQYAAQNKDMIGAFVRYIPPSRILKFIGRAAANRVWLAQLSIDLKQRKCLIQGHSYNTRLVSEFMLELKKMPYFSNVELVSVEQGSGDEGKESDFSIRCVMK